MVAFGNVTEHTADLVPPTKPGKVEMHSYYPKAKTSGIKIGPHCPSWLEDRKRDRRGFYKVNALAHEQGIAVPPQTVGLERHGHGHVVGSGMDSIERNHRHAPSEPAVNFLQRDDVGIDLAQDAQNSLMIAAAIQTDGLVYVVAGELDLHVRSRSVRWLRRI